MPTSPPKHQHAGYRTKADRDRANDDRRGTAAERGYGTRWQRYRRTFLQAHPLCVMCAARGTIMPATVVDHIVPARERPDLFWAATNHQALCALCHSRDKQRIDRGHQPQTLGPDGWPEG